MLKSEFWRNKTVLITGHTGFKGSWLALRLHGLGARLIGYALAPPTSPSLYESARVAELMHATYTEDVRDLAQLSKVFRDHCPAVVFHLAAQALVRYAYRQPVETYAINVMGTVNLLEAIRQTDSVRAVINVTSDKCYENREWLWGYREHERMGGHDPYSSSKGCAELVTAAYRQSFFNTPSAPALASVRAGNVIGGGDWAEDRLIPDIVRAFMRKEPVMIRNPHAVRPWQHVLEPLEGYLLLAERLWEDGRHFAEGWNFGPDAGDVKPVQWIVERLAQAWGEGAAWQQENTAQPHEAHYLSLDCAKAKARLGWQPRWSLETALQQTTEWYLAHQRGEEMRACCVRQIEAYQNE